MVVCASLGKLKQEDCLSWGQPKLHSKTSQRRKKGGGETKTKLKIKLGETQLLDSHPRFPLFPFPHPLAP